ncbi:GntR family transcriptional regulator [Micromonospora harpali]|uniref:GntR family transcriptional regulator n=1 Tax=Micromonospora harpali TaxID=1490225 RepID=A0ABW1HG31_9ACTN
MAEPIGTADRSLSAQIYEHLRTAIIEGEIAPGTKMREQWLADQLSVSRVPLREAIPLLEAEGLVYTAPRRGTFVTQLTLRDVDDLFDVRESLETLAARLAAQRSGQPEAKETVAALQDNLTRAKRAVQDGDDPAIAATSAEFHRLVVELSGNALLRTMMRPISGRVQWLFRLTAARDPRAACRAHEKLLRAILRGEVERAGELAFEHIASGRKPSLVLLADVLPLDGRATTSSRPSTSRARSSVAG